MEKEDKEMDLLELLSKFIDFSKKGLVKAIDLLLWFVRFHFKNKFLIGTFLVLGIAFAYYSANLARKLNADFTVQINGTTSSNLYDIVKALSQSVNEDGSPRLADSLGIDKKIVMPVRGLQPFYVIDLNNNGTRDYVDYDNKFVEDTLSRRMEQYLCIRIVTKGMTDFNVLQKGLVNYFRSNPYLKQAEIERIKMLNNEIKMVDTEIAVLDSLRQSDFKHNDYALSFDKITFIAQKQTYSDNIIVLKKKKSYIQRDLDVQSGVVTMYSRVTILPVSSDIYLWETRLFPMYIIGFLLALIVSYRKGIQKVIKG